MSRWLMDDSADEGWCQYCLRVRLVNGSSIFPLEMKSPLRNGDGRLMMKDGGEGRLMIVLK